MSRKAIRSSSSASSGRPRSRKPGQGLRRGGDSEARQPSGRGEEDLYFTVHLNPSQATTKTFPKSVVHHIAARLVTLKSMGLAEATDANAWHVRRDFETILRAMQRANDRQKMLAAHGALLSDERLQLVVEDVRKLEVLEGRVVLHGEEEGGLEAGRFYLLVEGTDGRLHHVYYTPEIHYARSLGKLRTNAFIRLRSVLTEDNGVTLDVQDFGDAEKLLQNRLHLLDTAQQLKLRGINPIEDGWNGWLGRYQAALVHSVEEVTRDRDQKIGIKPDRGSRSRR